MKEMPAAKVLLSFGILFFLGITLYSIKEYRKKRDRQSLQSLILSLAMVAISLFILVGRKFAVISLIILILVGIYALLLIFFGEPSNKVVEQLKSYNGKLTLKDALFTWKPLAWLKERVGTFWAAVIYAIILSTTCSILFSLTYLIISGKVPIYSLIGFLPTMMIVFFVRSYKALIKAYDER